MSYDSHFQPGYAAKPAPGLCVPPYGPPTFHDPHAADPEGDAANAVLPVLVERSYCNFRLCDITIAASRNSLGAVLRPAFGEACRMPVRLAL